MGNKAKAKRLFKKLESNTNDIYNNLQYCDNEFTEILELKNQIIITKILDLVTD